MKIYDIGNNLERLCNNAGLDLKNLEYCILDFLGGYFPLRSEEEAFNYILNNSDLEKIDQPLRLWKSYSTFRIGLAKSYDDFPRKKIKENLIAVLVGVVMSENQLLVLKRYHNEIAKAYPNESELLELEKKIRYPTLGLEFGAAVNIDDVNAKLSLFKAYLKNIEYLGLGKGNLNKIAIVLCGIIITHLKNNIPISEKYIEENLKKLEIIKKQAKEEEIHLNIDSFCALYHSLKDINSFHTPKAYKLYMGL